MYFVAVLIFFFGLLVARILQWKGKLPKNTPPGPHPLPIIGNVLQLKRAPMHLILQNWRNLYRSDTIGCYVGSRLQVTMHNLDTARKVFNREEASGRDQWHAIAMAAKGYGLIFSEGELWKTQRRFALSTLRDFGMGKSWLEDSIMDEVEDLCRLLVDLKSEPTDIKRILTHSVSNVISALVFGRRFPQTDKKFTNLTQSISAAVQRSDNTLHLMFPFLKYIPGHFKEEYQTMQRFLVDVRGFVQELIEEHGQSFRPDDVKDYIDAYINRDKSTKASGVSEPFDDDVQLVWSVFNLLNAGTDTVSNSSLWSIVYMLENPQILKNVQKEMDENLPADQPLHIAHRSLVPYTDATILEVQRFATVTPRALAHRNLVDIQIDGYDIPKNSILQVNIHSIHRDPRYWKNPDVFDPTRFLDETGKVFKPEAFIPFSIGKRSCLAESLAKQELFLFIGNLYRRFHFELPAGTTVSHKDVRGSFILSPKPYKVIVTPRDF